MVALLAFSDGESFATGLTDYNYRPATEQELMPRIMLQVMIQGLEATAVVDTGAPYVVCTSEIARSINLDPATSLAEIRLLIRGVSISGRLYRLPITFLARQGDDLTVDATAFIPNVEWEASWGSLPSFIGLSGCLERMRFAVDPVSDTFYFGPLSADG